MIFRPCVKMVKFTRICFNARAVFLFFLLFFSNSFSASISHSNVHSFGQQVLSGGPSRVSCTFSVSGDVITLTAGNDYNSFSSRTIILNSGYGSRVQLQHIFAFGGSSLSGSGCSCSTSSTFFGTSSSIVSHGAWTCSGESPCSGTNSGTSSCIASFTISDSSDVLPSCSELSLISAPVCQGGQGLFMRGSAFNLENKILGMYGPASDIPFNDGFTAYAIWDNQPQVLVATVPPAGAENNPSSRPDGSQCNLNDLGQLVDYLICPLGLANDLPSQSSASQSSPSQSSPSDNSEASSSSCKIVIDGVCMDISSDCKIMVNGVCMDKPDDDNCAIMLNGVCIEHKSSGSNGEGGNGGDGEGGNGFGCENLSNCDWAKLTVQLVQLGVSREVLEKLSHIAGLAASGYNLTQQQIFEMAEILKAIKASDLNFGNSIKEGTGKTTDAVDALRRRLDSLLGGTGEGGGFPNGTCNPNVSDCSKDFDVSEVDGFGISRYGVDSVLSRYHADTSSVRAGYSVSRLLADTSKVFPNTRRAVQPFNDYINKQSGGCRTQLDFSFDFGGFKCGSACKIDLSNFGGKPISKILSDIFTIAFGLGVLIRLMYVVRTIGQKG